MSLSLSSQEKIDLKRLLSTNECDDNTDYIRKFKHSSKIRNDLNEFLKLKGRFCENLPIYLCTRNQDEMKRVQDSFIATARKSCSFLNDAYPDIFMKMIKDELDIPLFHRLLDVLKQIEDNETDQHEASVNVGKILKEIYIDSALRHGNHLAEVYKKDDSNETMVIGKPISWKEYKMQNTNK